MEWRKAEEEVEKHQAEKVLPRELEQVSNLFLSRYTANGSALPVPRSISHEKTPSPEEEQPLKVVSRRFLKRDQLLSLLRKQPAALEEGMRLIDINVPCESSGSIALLGLDCTNQLTIIDLDDSPNEELLLRGLGHFEWMVRNHSIVNRMYREQPIDFSLQPRLMLVAPEFSPLTRSVVRLITAPRIHCLKYHSFGLAEGAGVFFERVYS